MQLQDVYEKLGNCRVMALATSVGDVVSARTVSVIVYEQKLYFQTDINMQKAKEIAINKNVSLCCDGIEIKGIAIDKGSTKEKDNLFFVKEFKQYFPKAYKKYTNLENEHVFCVQPVIIKCWNSDENKVSIICFDVKNNSYQEEKYL